MPDQVIRDGAVVADSWVLSDEGDLPAGDVIVPLTRWLEQRESLREHVGRIGVILTGDDDPTELGIDLHGLPVIALAFPRFADGRCYSHARVLREQLGYVGEIRAYGEILRDQAFYLRRCGVDTFVLSGDENATNFMEGFSDFSVTYQPAADDARPLWRRVRR